MNQAIPKVTIIIPAYNAMTYLPRTLNSVLKQTFHDFEVLIINDGSTDHILEWASNITASRVSIISKPNQGLAAARNTGIEHARGEYIAFLDADDLWEETKLEKQVQCLNNKPEVGLVYTWTREIDEHDRLLDTTYQAQLEGRAYEVLLIGDVVGGGSSTMIRKSCFDVVGVFDTSLKAAEDCEMWVRISSKYEIAVIKEMLVYYRRHSHNMSKDMNLMIQYARASIEKTYATAPLNLLYLRNQTYAHAFMTWAWESAYQLRDYHQANQLANLAVAHYPQMRYKTWFWKLKIVTICMAWFGVNSFFKLKDLTYRLRSRNSIAL